MSELVYHGNFFGYVALRVDPAFGGILEEEVIRTHGVPPAVSYERPIVDPWVSWCKGYSKNLALGSSVLAFVFLL